MTRAVQALAGKNVAVQVGWTEPGPDKPRGLDALFELERILLRRGIRGGADAASREEIGEGFPIISNPDVVVDFSAAGGESETQAADLRRSTTASPANAAS